MKTKKIVEPKVKRAPAKAKKIKALKPLTRTVGRRKASVARVLLKNGSGAITVNNKDYREYFDTDVARLDAAKPFSIFPVGVFYDAEIKVAGGGLKGQAGAVKLGIARALLAIDEKAKEALREHNLLTVDSRHKERKKYGQRGARRKFQFVKR